MSVDPFDDYDLLRKPFSMGSARGFNWLESRILFSARTSSCHRSSPRFPLSSPSLMLDSEVPSSLFSTVEGDRVSQIPTEEIGMQCFSSLDEKPPTHNQNNIRSFDLTSRFSLSQSFPSKRHQDLATSRTQYSLCLEALQDRAIALTSPMDRQHAARQAPVSLKKRIFSSGNHQEQIAESWICQSDTEVFKRSQEDGQNKDGLRKVLFPCEATKSPIPRLAVLGPSSFRENHSKKYSQHSGVKAFEEKSLERDGKYSSLPRQASKKHSRKPDLSLMIPHHSRHNEQSIPLWDSARRGTNIEISARVQRPGAIRKSCIEIKRVSRNGKYWPSYTPKSETFQQVLPIHLTPAVGENYAGPIHDFTTPTPSSAVGLTGMGKFRNSRNFPPPTPLYERQNCIADTHALRGDDILLWSARSVIDNADELNFGWSDGSKGFRRRRGDFVYQESCLSPATFSGYREDLPRREVRCLSNARDTWKGFHYSKTNITPMTTRSVHPNALNSDKICANLRQGVTAAPHKSSFARKSGSNNEYESELLNGHSRLTETGLVRHVTAADHIKNLQERASCPKRKNFEQMSSVPWKMRRSTEDPTTFEQALEAMTRERPISASEKMLRRARPEQSLDRSLRNIEPNIAKQEQRKWRCKFGISMSRIIIHCYVFGMSRSTDDGFAVLRCRSIIL